MIKKIVLWVIMFFTGLWVNQLFAEAVTLNSMNSKSTFVLHKIWTTNDLFVDNQYKYIEDWWYFISNWSATCFYDHRWVAINPAPFDCGAFSYVYSRSWKYQTIETERFQYFITKPYNSVSSQSGSGFKTSYIIIYDKKGDDFYQHKYTHSNSHTSAPYWYFLDGNLYFKHVFDSSRYKFDISDEFWHSFISVNTPWPNIQHNSAWWYSSSYLIKYNWSDTSSYLYHVWWNSLYWTAFVSDPDLWILKISSSKEFPTNPLNINITRTSYQDYNCLNYKWDILCSFYSWDHTAPTESNFWVYSYKYNSQTQSWTYYPDVYFMHYNNHYFDWSDFWWGWYQSKESIIQDNLKFTYFWPLKVWFYSESSGGYKKTYFTSDSYLKTNDVLWTDIDFDFWDETPDPDTGTWTDDTSTGNTTDPSDELDLSDDSESFFSSILNSFFWVDESDITWIKESLSWALEWWSNWFSIWEWWTSWINYTPWNSDYWNIINRDNNKKTCDMFNTDWSFAYYSNWSYDLTIDLNWILNLAYVDKVPFLEELLFIPNKILSFITNPLQNIFSTLRVFGWIWENTYCYFWTLQTIEFQKHIKVWTSFFGWELIFIQWTLTIIDYLILFFMWLPLLILTVRILLY